MVPEIPIRSLRLPGLRVVGSRARRSGRDRGVARERVVVVGNGMVGQRCCERLVQRRSLDRYDVTIIADEPVQAYDRVHLTDVWRGRPPDDLVLRGLSWYADHGIALRLGQRASAIDRDRGTVVTQEGVEYAYDKLVLATGSHATLPNIPVEGGAEPLRYRTLQDAQRIRETVLTAAQSSPVVAVIGGGLLGLEAARTLQLRGCRVFVLEGSSQLMPRQLDPEASKVLEGALAAAGIELVLRARVSRLSRHGDEVTMHLEDGTERRADAVVAAAGARATDDLARSAGLRCSIQGGVLVDAQLRTSDRRIFAISECASHAHAPHGLVAPGYAMADVLAGGLSGRTRRLEPQHIVTRLKLDLAEVTVLGNPLESGAGTELLWTAPGVHRRLGVSRRRVIAAVAIGAWTELAPLQRLVATGARIDRHALRRFVTDGSLGLDDQRRRLAVCDDATIVCQCASVTCGELRRAIALGHDTPDELARATSASTLCGSCRPDLGELCGAPPSMTPAPRTTGLLVAAFAALAFAVRGLSREASRRSGPGPRSQEGGAPHRRYRATSDREGCRRARRSPAVERGARRVGLERPRLARSTAPIATARAAGGRTPSVASDAASATRTRTRHTERAGMG